MFFVLICKVTVFQITVRHLGCGKKEGRSKQCTTFFGILDF